MKPSKLDPFRHLLGQVDDTKLAKMAGVPVLAVRSARQAMERQDAAAEASPGPGADAPRETSEEPSPEVLEDASPRAADDVSPPASPDAPPPAERKPAPEPKPPRLVEVVRSAWIDRFPPTGRPRRIGRGDVYRDDVARHLWEHHRALVRPYEA